MYHVRVRRPVPRCAKRRGPGRRTTPLSKRLMQHRRLWPGGFLSDVPAVVAGDRQDREVSVGPQSDPCDLGAAHVGHGEVGDEGIDLKLLQHLDRLPACARGPNRNTSFLQHTLYELAHNRLVVHDQARARPRERWPTPGVDRGSHSPCGALQGQGPEGTTRRGPTGSRPALPGRRHSRPRDPGCGTGSPPRRGKPPARPRRPGPRSYGRS